MEYSKLPLKYRRLAEHERRSYIEKHSLYYNQSKTHVPENIMVAFNWAATGQAHFWARVFSATKEENLPPIPIEYKPTIRRVTYELQ